MHEWRTRQAFCQEETDTGRLTHSSTYARTLVCTKNPLQPCKTLQELQMLSLSLYSRVPLNVEIVVPNFSHPGNGKTDRQTMLHTKELSGDS